MDSLPIDNKTRVLGQPKDWPEDANKCNSLEILDAMIDGSNVMLSQWKPSPDEIDLLVSGAQVNLYVWGTGHPPVALTVGKQDDTCPEFEVARVLPELAAAHKAQRTPLDIDKEGQFVEHLLNSGFKCVNMEDEGSVFVCNTKIAYDFYLHARDLEQQDAVYDEYLRAKALEEELSGR